MLISIPSTAMFTIDGDPMQGGPFVGPKGPIPPIPPLRSLGEIRVRMTFNPSSVSDVDTIKEAAAAMIDFCNLRKQHAEDVEERELWDLAMRDFERASMWAVKAATYKSS